jgi:hypothetical protein
MTNEELVMEIEKLFDCRDGDYRSFHTVRGENVCDFLPYYSFGFLGKGSTTFEDLRQALLDQFKELRLEYGPILYWRYAKEERIQEDTQEAAIKIMTRVAIPGIDHRLFSLEGRSYPEVKPRGL